jgi:hypothetical protein
MMMTRQNPVRAAALQLVILFLSLQFTLRADNKVLGQVEFHAENKAAESSGVWIDGQYLGYVNELKGNKKVLLLPGEHEISVRQSGYLDFNQKVTVAPGKKIVMSVTMEKDSRAKSSAIKAQIKLKVKPDRAAVFLDGAFAGTVREFNGWGQAMLVNPGRHHVKIDLTGYVPFDTDVNLLPYQKITIETNLAPSPTVQTDQSPKKK